MVLRVLVADDHALFRRGLSDLLRRDPQIQVVGEAEDGHGAVRMAAEHRPDVVLMDLGMPVMNGVEATRLITARQPGVNVITMSLYSDRYLVLQAVDAGARGYLVKQNIAHDLLPAVRAVAGGESYFSPVVAELIRPDGAVRRASAGESARGPHGSPPGQRQALSLTTDERQVLRLLADGKIDGDPSLSLSLSPEAVEACLQQVLKKVAATCSTGTEAKHAVP